MNRYEASDGTKYTEAQIQRLLHKSYEEERNNNPSIWCEGCGGVANCHAHIIPKARCKQLHKTELIWFKGNYFRSCYRCNLALENPKGEAWFNLKNITDCLNVMQKYDPELYRKFILNPKFAIF